MHQYRYDVDILPLLVSPRHTYFGQARDGDPLLTRRNVILRGAHLAPLIGEEFSLESGLDRVTLRGRRPAPPPEARPATVTGLPRVRRRLD